MLCSSVLCYALLCFCTCARVRACVCLCVQDKELIARGLADKFAFMFAQPHVADRFQMRNTYGLERLPALILGSEAKPVRAREREIETEELDRECVCPCP